MKTLFFSILATIIVCPAFAAGTEINAERVSRVELRREHEAVYSVKATLVNAGTMRPSCPPNAMCAPASFVTLAFTLNGCVDDMGPVSVRLQQDAKTNKIDLFVNALAFADEASKRTRCIAANTQVLTFPVGFQGFLSKSQIQNVYSDDSFLIKKAK